MVPRPMLLKQRLVASWYPGFKLAVFLLLIANTAVFILQGTASEGLDSAAWLILLLLFELETAHGKRLASRAEVFVVHNARFAAGVTRHALDRDPPARERLGGGPGLEHALRWGRERAREDELRHADYLVAAPKSARSSSMSALNDGRACWCAT
jgi:hypothetical protein